MKNFNLSKFFFDKGTYAQWKAKKGNSGAKDRLRLGNGRGPRPPAWKPRSLRRRKTDSNSFVISKTSALTLNINVTIIELTEA